MGGRVVGRWRCSILTTFEEVIEEIKLRVTNLGTPGARRRLGRERPRARAVSLVRQHASREPRGHGRVAVRRAQHSQLADATCHRLDSVLLAVSPVPAQANRAAGRADGHKPPFSVRLLARSIARTREGAGRPSADNGDKRPCGDMGDAARFVRGVALLFLRYTHPPAKLMEWFEDFLDDDQPLKVRVGDHPPTYAPEREGRAHFAASAPRDWTPDMPPVCAATKSRAFFVAAAQDDRPVCAGSAVPEKVLWNHATTDSGAGDAHH